MATSQKQSNEDVLMSGPDSDDLTPHLEEATRKLTELAAENKQLREHLRRSNEQLKAQCNMLESMQASRLKEQTSIEQRLELAKSTAADLRERVSQLESNLNKSEHEKQELKAKLTKHNPAEGKGEAASASSSGSSDKMREQLSSQVREAEEKIRQLTAEKSLLELKLAATENKMQAFQSEISNMRATRDVELTSAISRVSELENDIKRKEHDRSELQTKLNQLQAKLEQLQAAHNAAAHGRRMTTTSSSGNNAEIELLRENLYLAEAMRISLDSELKVKTSELTNARQELAKQDAALTECQRKLADAENDVIFLKFQAEAYRMDFNVEKSDLEREKEEKRVISERVRELESHVRQLQNEINSHALTQLQAAGVGDEIGIGIRQHPHHWMQSAGGDDVCDGRVS